MKKLVDIKEIAKTFHEWSGCRYIAVHDMPDLGYVWILLSNSKMIYDEGTYDWTGAEDLIRFCQIELIDKTGEYSTDGKIDAKKCLFDFGENHG